jgi:hypothetical protein
MASETASAEITFFGNTTLNSTAEYTITNAAAVATNGNLTANLNANDSSLPNGISILSSPVLAE